MTQYSPGGVDIAGLGEGMNMIFGQDDQPPLIVISFPAYISQFCFINNHFQKSCVYENKIIVTVFCFIATFHRNKKC